MHALEIRSFARLHFGLLQMSAAYTRRNMGIGAALNSPCWRLRFKRLDPREILVVTGPEHVAPEITDAARAAVGRFQDCGAEPVGLGIEVAETIPSHVGLGSKTAFLKAVRAAYGLLTTGDHAFLPIESTARGGTSGIGVNLNDAGGVVVDAGHRWSPEDVMDTSRARAGAPAPGVVARYQVADGMLLLARMRDEEGPCGRAESNIFRRTLPLAPEEADRVAGNVLFEALPALASGDWAAFGHALAMLQRMGFKKEEWHAQSDATKRLAQLAYEAGAHCAALSSMGPTLAIIADDLQAVKVQLEEVFADAVLLAPARVHNSGMEWTILE